MYRRVSAAALALVLIACLFPGVGAAAGEPSAQVSAATVSLTATAGPQGRVILNAQVNSSEGRPVSNHKVQFFVQTSFFGQRAVLLGEGITDTTGSATVSFEPTWVGQHQFTASFVGGEGYDPASGEAAFDVSSIRSPQPAEAAGLQLIRQATGLVALLVTAGVWAILLLIVLRVGLGLRRSLAKSVGDALGRTSDSAMRAS